MTNAKPLSAYKPGKIELENRIVIPPRAHSRAIGKVRKRIMTECYDQITVAGLIITEETSPSSNDLGYIRIPGIDGEAQVASWKQITEVSNSPYLNSEMKSVAV